MATTATDLPLPPKENFGPTILASTLSMVLLALVSTILRVWVRARVIRNIGWDDYAMMFAMLLAVAGELVIIVDLNHGAGQHRAWLDPSEFYYGIKLNFVTQPLFLWAICFVKVSVGLFLLRIASTPRYRKVIAGITIFMLVYTLICFFTLVFQCTNLAIMWSPPGTVNATCFGQTTLQALSYTNVALSILTDLLFSIVIPIPMLWNVQMNKRTKTSIMAILGLGLFASAAAMVKISYITNYGKTGDFLWDSRNICIWTVIEAATGVIAGNLPCLKPLFRRVLDLSYGSGSRNRSKAPGYGYGNSSSRYGHGTHHSVNNYSTLGSKVPSTNDHVDTLGLKTHDGESHMMTRISARGVSGGERDSELGDADKESQMSDDSIARLEGRQMGITKTTTTKVTYIEDPAVAAGKVVRPEHKL